MTKRVSFLHVRALNARSSAGFLVAGHIAVPCGLGRSGRTWRKREGDGATPRGIWPLRRMLVKPGRSPVPGAALPRSSVRREDGWCDDPSDRNYNKPVKLPYRATHEALWRDDQLYDVLVILGYNDRPRIRGKGSAVFFHLRQGLGETAGCVAISLRDMRKILPLCGPQTRMIVW